MGIGDKGRTLQQARRADRLEMGCHLLAPVRRWLTRKPLSAARYLAPGRTVRAMRKVNRFRPALAAALLVLAFGVNEPGARGQEPRRVLPRGSQLLLMWQS